MKTIANIIHNNNSSLFIIDSDGNPIYFEDESLDIRWAKQQFDSDNNKIYYEDSDGWWDKREYDSNGNRTYYENSAGRIEDTR